MRKRIIAGTIAFAALFGGIGVAAASAGAASPVAAAPHTTWYHG